MIIFRVYCCDLLVTFNLCGRFSVVSHCARTVSYQTLCHLQHVRGTVCLNHIIVKTILMVVGSFCSASIKIVTDVKLNLTCGQKLCDSPNIAFLSPPYPPTNPPCLFFTNLILLSYIPLPFHILPLISLCSLP